jgi:hypothetical protein
MLPRAPVSLFAELLPHGLISTFLQVPALNYALPRVSAHRNRGCGLGSRPTQPSNGSCECLIGYGRCKTDKSERELANIDTEIVNIPPTINNDKK